MVNIDKRTRQMLIQDVDLSRERIENSRKPRLNANIDICYGHDIVWAVWPNGQAMIRGRNWSQRRPCEPVGL